MHAACNVRSRPFVAAPSAVASFPSKPSVATITAPGTSFGSAAVSATTLSLGAALATALAATASAPS